MIGTIQSLFPYLVLASHVLLAILFLALIFRNSWGREMAEFVGKHSIVLGLIVSLAAVGGSLFYSELVGYPPCVLCWWQRLFLYPQVILFVVALWWKDKGVYKYSAALALIAGIIALYHSYVYWGGESLLPCTALGGACSKIYVMAFGYITIPSMSLTIVLYLLLLAWANYLYTKNANSNS